MNYVGDDAYTPQMLLNYKNDGIDTRYIFQEKNIASGHALVMIGGEGNNYLSVAPGANYLLTPQVIDGIKNVFDEATMIVMQYEILAETIQHVIKLAYEKKIPVLWNFAPARNFNFSFLKMLDILVVNEVEAEFVSGVKVKSLEDAKSAGKAILSKGVKNVVVTLGVNGAFTLNQIEEIYTPAFKVKNVDTTGAGDVFCGALAVALVEEKPMKEAVRFATAAAALSVSKLGAQPSIPFRQEIVSFLEEKNS